MEEARELERWQAIRDRHPGRRVPSSPIDPEAHAPVSERVVILRRALDDLEVELALRALPGGGGTTR